MKVSSFSLLVSISLLASAHADLTIVQKIEGAGSATDMTMKIKGSKARLEMGTQITSIIDGDTGEVVNLMHDQKSILRMSANQATAAAEMARKFSGTKQDAARPKLTATGKTQKMNGFDVQEYTCETPNYSATYWIATNYPDGAAILKQMQNVLPKAWGSVNTGMPDYSDLPGLPLKSIVSMKEPKLTSTITVASVKQAPVDETEFKIPTDYKEMKIPDIFGGGKKAEPNIAPVDARPANVPGAAVTPSATP